MKLKHLIAIGFLTISSFVQAALVEGQHYNVLPKPLPALAANKDKIEVTEFFSFVCIHCRHLDPIMRHHKKSFASDTAFRAEHVIWDDEMLNLAKILVAIEQTRTQDTLNPLVFNALFDQKIELNKPEIFREWIMQQKGVDSAKILEVYQSFFANAEANRMKQLTSDYGINSTPMVIVGGKYQLILTSDFNASMKVLDELIAKVRAERGLAAPKSKPLPRAKGAGFALGLK
ncbi:thiol:disulfide interchange protein DsbA/DsbL [Neisseria sp. Ec49-e6-T10]|uniref:thiol:disulfide interchange protein DsbA/DsbL n=1 Tax=Neisseria sp. Ec49-e6-T10 TaxID=3140744 RepID=UPI003EBF72FB